MADNATPQEIYKLISGSNEDEPNTACQPGYIEHWEAYGSHHKGSILKVWWNGNAAEDARREYEELLAQGIKPSAD